MGDHEEDEFGNVNTWTPKEAILNLQRFKAMLEGKGDEWFFDHFGELLEIQMQKGKGKNDG